MSSGTELSILWICIWCAISYGWFLLVQRMTTKLPPGPVGLPLLGSLFELRTMPHESLARLSTRYGPLMTIRLGLQTTVVVSSKEMAEEVLQRHDKVFAGRVVSDTLEVLDQPKWGMIFNQNGPTWRGMRRICNTHLFTPKQLDSMRGLRERKVRALLDHIRARCADEGTVDVGECVFATAFNLLSNSVFSRDVVDLESRAAGEFKDMVWGIMEAAGTPNLADFFPVLKRVDPQGLRRRVEALGLSLQATMDEMIDQRLESYAKRDQKEGEKSAAEDFLDVLLRLSQDSGSGFAKESTKALLADLFTAGTETTTSSVEWAMAELLRHPEKMAAARTELRRVIGDRHLVEESDVPQLPYLQAVVKETLRLHPPAPLLIPHRADLTIKICGFTVPKHTQVLVNGWAIARDVTYWTEPTSFLPERFIGSDINFKGKDLQFIPFGAGRRMCPGLPLADRMVHVLLASLIHCFSWRLPDGIEPEQLDMRSKFGITLQKAMPLKAIPFDPLL